MNPAWWLGYPIGAMAAPWLASRECAALALAVVSLLFFRAFRERYLLAWSLGWIAYAAFLFTARTHELKTSPLMEAFSPAALALALGLFAVTLLLAARAARMLVPMLMAVGVVVAAAALRPIYVPDDPMLLRVLDGACRLIALFAGFQLFRDRLGRLSVAPFLAVAGLLTLQLRWPPLTNHILELGFLLLEVLFGSSIFVLALEDSRVRTRRLFVLNEMVAAIQRAQHHGTMMQAALEKLKNATGARASWFRLLEADTLVLTQHVGVSQEFLRAVGQIRIDTVLERVLQENKAAVLQRSEAPAEIQEQLKKQGIHRVVMLPIEGKKSVIGLLALGLSWSARPSNEEIEFLDTIAHQLGIAVENLRLLEQVLRSQRQWMNTFDSIQDLILAHDTEFRILKTNQALLQRLEKAPADVLGKHCDEVLPQIGAWSGCPYCERVSGLDEGMDPCFGGQSVVSTSPFTEQGSQQKGTIHVVRDTTERHAAEEKYRMLFEQAQEGVFVATPEGKLLDCNDAFVTMLGYSSREELMALDVGSVLYPIAEERESFRKEIEAHNYVRNFEITVRRKDGTFLTAAESCFATRDVRGQIERYQGFLLDITEKKRSEDDMRRRN